MMGIAVLLNFLVSIESSPRRAAGHAFTVAVQQIDIYLPSYMGLVVRASSRSADRNLALKDASYGMQLTSIAPDHIHSLSAHKLMNSLHSRLDRPFSQSAYRWQQDVNHMKFKTMKLNPPIGKHVTSGSLLT
jgi:hypothetical protein